MCRERAQERQRKSHSDDRRVHAHRRGGCLARDQLRALPSKPEHRSLRREHSLDTAAAVQIDERKHAVKQQVARRDYIRFAKMNRRIAIGVCRRNMKYIGFETIHMEGHLVGKCDDG